MFESEKDRYEYHLLILSVKMKVKFPCKMKIQHLGSLITGQIAQSDDNRYIFNQEIILNDQTQKEFFELTVNLITDKGAKYIAGAIKIYHSQLIRSEGERLVLSLSKCIDTQAFCQIKVDQVSNNKVNRNAPFDKRSMVQIGNINRQIPYKNRDVGQYEFSPMKHNAKVMESKSQYNFPINQLGGLKRDWETKSRGRLQPPQTVYQKSKIAPKVNYIVQQAVPYPFNEGGQNNHFGRQKALEAQVYKQGYQKLKEKYKKQTQINKSQLNKRLALQNSQNNLKLQIMRCKIKIQQLQKSLNDKNQRIKDQQTHLSNLQQKQMQNTYLKQQIHKNQNALRILQDKNRNLLKTMNEMKDYATSRNQQDFSNLKSLQLQNQNLKMKLQTKQRQFQKQIRLKMDLLQQKQFELISKKQHIQRQKKNNIDLQKNNQIKIMQLQKLLQNQKNNQKIKIQQNKNKIQKLQKQILKHQHQKKDNLRQIEQFKNNILKFQYQKKIINQQFQNLKIQYNQIKNYKQKYNQLYRQNKNLQEEKLSIEKQIEKIVQSKDYNISQINKQYHEQIQYYKRNNRELEEKSKTIANKLIEVQGQLDISRNQQDKTRRNLQSLIKQAAESKQKQKNAKKGQKSIELEYASMQSQMATLKQKLKSIDHIHKLQLQKARQQSEKLKIQLENQLIKLDELDESNNHHNMQISRLKIKLQYAQQKIDKDASVLKQKQNQIQNLIRDYEEQISSLDNNINNLRANQKDFSTKIQKNEIEIIKLQQKVQKSKKQIKILQQKIINYQSSLKAKTLQYSTTFQQKQLLSKKLNQNEDQTNRLKIENLGILNQKNKNIKINELLQEQCNKLKNQISNLNSIIFEKQKNNQNLLNQIKKQKDQYIKLQFKYVNIKKQGQKNKQLLNQTINKYIATLTIINKQQQKKNFLDFLNHKTQSNTFADLINLIIYQAKQIKQLIIKQLQLNKQLSREIERLHEQLSNSTKDYHNTQQILKKQVQQLQRQLNLVIQDRDNTNTYRDNIQFNLNQRIQQLQQIQSELNSQNQELNFTINSLKMDFDAINEQNVKKMNNLRRINQQYQQKVQEQLMIIADLDERCSTLQGELDNLNQNLLTECELNIKKEKNIDDFKTKKQQNDNLINQLKKHKKQLTQKCSQLQLYLNTQKQINSKLQSSAQQQQKKINELKIFISSLMKQKQLAIKNQLQRQQANINLQSQLSQLKKQLQTLRYDNDKYLSINQNLKQQIKKYTTIIKQLQMDKNQQKIKYNKLSQKIRQKQKEIMLKQEITKKLQQKIQKISQKHRHQKQQIQQQIDFRTSSTKQQIKSFNDKILQLQTQLIKKQSQINILQSKLQQFQFQIFNKNQKINEDQVLYGKLKLQNQELLIKINGLDINNNQLSDQLKEKQEKLFQCSGKIFSLENKMEASQRQMQEQFQMYRLEYNQNNERMIEEYEQRLELVQKQRDYYQQLMLQKDKQILKLNNLIKNQQTSEYNLRKGYEQRLKKLQEQKLSLFTLKSNEIHRLLQQNSQLTQTAKQRQSQSKRVGNELQVARKTILNLDIKVKDFDQKIKSVNKIYQLQMQQLKKKDVAYKNYKQNVNNYQWNLERQIKKHLQSFIKNSIQIMEDKQSQKNIELARNLQKSIIEILNNKIIQK